MSACCAQSRPRSGSRARGSERPDSDLDLLVTVPDAWLASHSRFEETGDLSPKLAYQALNLDRAAWNHLCAELLDHVAPLLPRTRPTPALS
jgi:predicted nucleotidyltransferase